MPRESRVEFRALNVKAHPHPEGIYEKLWISAAQMGSILKFRGDKWGMVGTWQVIKVNGKPAIEGELWRFTYIDPNEPWFNVEKKAEATAEDLKAIQIPNHLKPSMKRFRYLFATDQHQLFVQTYGDGETLGIEPAQNFVFALLNQKALELPAVVVDLVQDKESLSRFIQRSHLQTLFIDISKPNPDRFSKEDEDDLFEAMSREGVKRKKIELIAENDEGIKPNEETLKQARVAATNGHVKATALSPDGGTKIFDTKNHPITEAFTYMVGRDSLVERFRTNALDLLARLIK